MPLVRKSAIVPHPCATMFALVDRVEDYPLFLPWCSRVELLERTAEITSARLHVQYRGLATSITTRNVKRPVESMELALLEGPFESFRGSWRFVALGEAGCRAEFELDYTLAGAALAAVLQPVFGHIAGTLVDSFVARAAAADPSP
jgi:ribosome-associated toxin RatA of RatAB toxin-antitoxin module